MTKKAERVEAMVFQVDPDVYYYVATAEEETAVNYLATDALYLSEIFRYIMLKVFQHVALALYQKKSVQERKQVARAVLHLAEAVGMR